MEHVINQLSSQPLLIAILVVVVVLLLVSIVKKLFKLALVLFLAGIIFVGYIYYTEEDPKAKIQQYIQQGKESAKEIKEKATEVSGDIQEAVEQVEDKK